MLEFLSQLFDTSDFPARWNCGHWTAGHGWLHILSDLGIWGAYLAIPCVLGYFIFKRQNLPFWGILALFGGFILACGTTHLMEAVIFWWPAYRLAGVIKLVTATVSWATVLALIPTIQSVMTLRTPAEFEREIVARKRAEEALLKANAELETRVDEIRSLHELILASVGDGIYGIDSRGCINFENAAAANLLGWTADEVVGKPLDATVLRHEADRQEPRRDDDPIRSTLRDGQSRHVQDVTFLRQDGTNLAVEYSVGPLRDADGHLRGATVIFRDITASKESADNLARAMKELEDVKVAIDEHSIVAITDSKGKIIFVNDKFCAISKYAREELLGQDHRIINSGHHPKEFIRGLWTTILQGRVWKGELKNRAKDGSYYWVDTTIVPFLDADGKPYQFVAIRTDITASKESADNLARAMKELEDVKVAIDEHSIVAITDSKGKIIFVNDKFCAISKYAREELLGQDHRIINSGHHPKEFIRDLWTTILQGRVWKGELKNRAKDGSHYWVDTTIVPFLDADGKPYQFVAIRTDITERERITRAFKAANKELALLSQQNEQRADELERRVLQRTADLHAANKELEAFSYSVSHDLRAPLRSVDSFSRIVLEDYGPQLDDEGRRLLNVVRSEARRMGQLIDDLLDFSRTSRQQMQAGECDMTALVQDVFDSLDASLQSRVRQFDLQPLPPAHGDRAMLRQVVFNLLANAVKFTGQQPEPVIEIGGSTGTGFNTYYVRDNGVGFDQRYVHKLFAVFQRLHTEDEFEGTGVGLALVQRIINRHGGQVWAEGKLNAGATFYFTLPIGKKA